MTTDEKLNALHDRLLDPDEGIFARVHTVQIRLDQISSVVAKHDRAFVEIERRFDAIEQRQSKVRGWLLGVAAAGGIGGSIAAKLAGLLS